MAPETSTLEVLLHPVRLRILQAVAGRTVTTSELAELIDDVAAATVYRHVSTLLTAGALKVVSQRRVRGAVERTLSLDDERAHGDESEAARLSDDQHRQAFTVFLAHLASEFDRFIKSSHENTMSLFGYGQSVLYVSQGDIQLIQEKLHTVLAPYFEPRGDDEHRVSLATLLIPETEDPQRE